MQSSPGDPPPSYSLPVLDPIDRIIQFRRITAETLKRAREQDDFHDKFEVIDCRDSTAYNKANLFNSINLNSRNDMENYFHGSVKMTKAVIIYCDYGTKDSPAMAMTLGLLDFIHGLEREIYVLDNGCKDFVLDSQDLLMEVEQQMASEEQPDFISLAFIVLWILIMNRLDSKSFFNLSRSCHFLKQTSHRADAVPLPGLRLNAFFHNFWRFTWYWKGKRLRTDQIAQLVRTKFVRIVSEIEISYSAQQNRREDPWGDPMRNMLIMELLNMGVKKVEKFLHRGEERITNRCLPFLQKLKVSNFVGLWSNLLKEPIASQILQSVDLIRVDARDKAEIEEFLKTTYIPMVRLIRNENHPFSMELLEEILTTWSRHEKPDSCLLFDVEFDQIELHEILVDLHLTDGITVSKHPSLDHFYKIIRSTDDSYLLMRIYENLTVVIERRLKGT